MKIISNNSSFTIPERTVVAIGKFDGDHLGHQKIFEEMRRIKNERGLKMAAFTFSYVNQPLIVSNDEKHKLIEAEGVDYLVEYPFTDDIKKMPGRDFILQILKGKMNMAHIVAGDDCTFGYNKSGDPQLLYAMSQEQDFQVSIISKLKLNDREISSTMIREMISNGDTEGIFRIKGSYYSISGTVIKNKQLGQKIGFPTVNIIPPEEKMLPKRGVYATITETADGHTYHSMTNIGYNPSVQENEYSGIKCETHIFDFYDDIYGQDICIRFVKYIREEIRFESIEQLKMQLEEDKNNIKLFFDSKVN